MTPWIGEALKLDNSESRSGHANWQHGAQPRWAGCVAVAGSAKIAPFVQPFGAVQVVRGPPDDFADSVSLSAATVISLSISQGGDPYTGNVSRSTTTKSWAKTPRWCGNLVRSPPPLADRLSIAWKKRLSRKGKKDA